MAMTVASNGTLTIFYESNDESEEEIPRTRQQIGQVNKGHKRWSEKPAPNQQIRNRATGLCWAYNKRGTYVVYRDVVLTINV